MGSGEILLALSMVLYAVGMLVGSLFRGKPAVGNAVTHALALPAAVAGAGAAAWSLATGQPITLSLGSSFPFAPWQLRVDGLSAFFLLTLSLIVPAVSVYALAHVREYEGHPGFRSLGALYNAFILSMALVITAGNAFFFLVAWELTALTSFFLVVFRHEDAAARRAGFIYLVMAHAGAACIAAAFLLVYHHTGTFDFAGWAEFARSAGGLPATARGVAFVLALIGFGAKAGVIPLHVWLPLAHPAAPSHVSALMSGVMLKTAIYGLLRLLGVLGPAQPWWGVLLVVLAAVTALLGVIYALMENDLKRLLAYSSIENIGIILLGIGVALALQAAGRPEVAALAFTAALYHTLNHALFKGLLFLAAGAVIGSTHTGDMERLGGLAKRMPWTALLFLAGSLAISALPPLNGFVSEWLTFQSLLALGHAGTPSALWLLAPIGGAALALTGALAAACFIKAYGVTFLALPRSSQAGQAREVQAPLLGGMAVLAALCLLLGVWPGLALRLMAPAVAQMTGVGWIGAPVAGVRLSGAGVDGVLGNLSPLALAAVMAGLAAAVYAVVRAAAGPGGSRVGATWGCGIALTPRMEYTASAFAKPFRIIFRQILRPRRTIEASYEAAPYFACSLRYREENTPVFETYLYRPATRLLIHAAQRLRGIQAGGIQGYLAYILLTLVVLLVVAL